MKSKLLIPVTCLGLLATATGASAYMLDDEYYGHDDHGYGDIIASQAEESMFDILGADASLVGDSLTIKIYTGFAGQADERLYENFTQNDTGLGYGDLFLSTGWVPYGSHPYTSDNAENGNHWTHVFALNDPFSADGGSGTVYELGPAVSGTNNPDALLSEHFMDCGGRCVYRNGQEVAAKDGLDEVGSGTWDLSPGYLSFTLPNFSSLGLDASNLGLHWTMYCANDVIEGLVSASVPEPRTISLTLLGLGLLGLAFARQRRSPNSAP